MTRLPAPYTRAPDRELPIGARAIAVFDSGSDANVDPEVVESFGDEWNKFSAFDDDELARIAAEYFDILDGSMLSPSTYAADFGCGTGRFSKALAARVGFIEAVDPSRAVVAAERMLRDVPNARVTQASIDALPFADETFDFAMSVGVLHHIPDTQRALADCVRKVKRGGWFYTYLYYALDNRGPAYRALFSAVNALREQVSALPPAWKRRACDALAVGLYLPPVLLGRALSTAGLSAIGARLPLAYYQSKSFYVMRNDALDRFGTTLEQRFTRAEVVALMQRAGLDDIVVSDGMPCWHAVGRKR